MNGKDMKWILPLALVTVIILSIIGIATMQGPEEEEEGPYTMKLGPFTDENGNPLEGVIITLKGEDGEKVDSEVTDSDGYAAFEFKEQIDAGHYILGIEKDGYKAQDVNVSLGYQADKISVQGLDSEGVILEPVELPPVELSVGPISGPGGLIEGAEVTLKRDGTVIGTSTTDADGMVNFVFDEPPATGEYVINITKQGFVSVENTIDLEYVEETNNINVNGVTKNIVMEKLTPPTPPGPKQDPDYYKKLEGYQAVEGGDEKPVDVEEKMDPNGDGTPEFQSEIEETAAQDVDVSDRLGTDDQGDPEYSPEINSYEPMDPDPYLEDKTRRANTGEGGVNLTDYEDFVAQGEMFDNGTDEIVQHDEEDLVDPAEDMGGFSSEVADVTVIIEDNLALGFVNGTNMTDENGDGDIDHIVSWKVAYYEEDRDGDNVTDLKKAAVQAFEMWDNNSNGYYDPVADELVNYEYSKGMQAGMVAYDNNSDGHFEDVAYAVVKAEEAKVDGNLTDSYSKMGIYWNHTVDSDNDTYYELHRAALYVVEKYDNNSNGHYELVKQFAGGYEAVDNNSNGEPEKAFMVWGGSEGIDANDDGVEDQNRTLMWIYKAVDMDEDKNPEEQYLLVHATESWDNNTNGHFEDKSEFIAGFKVMDENSDGNPEEQAALMTVGKEWDTNDDGTVDSNTSVGHIYIWEDTNDDSIPEHQHAVFYFSQNFDNNSNGHFETQREMIVGYSVDDPDSDGVENEVFALLYGVEKTDSQDQGDLDHFESFAQVLRLKDADGDGNPEEKHAIFGYEQKWDNNTDGEFEAVDQFMAAYEGLDEDSDGSPDEETFLIIVNHTVDADSDGNPETITHGIMASHVEYDDNGNVSYARHVFVHHVAYDNNSNGYFELERAMVAGHEGFNGTENTTTGNMTWETEHVQIYFVENKDSDDDGTWDEHNEASVEF